MGWGMGNGRMPDISLDLYKIFCTVVRAGNMSAAAKKLFISQPAVSMAVRQLEGKLGSPLLVRSVKGVRTTPEGEVLYQYLEQGLGLIQRAEEKYYEMLHLTAGELKIGASDTVIANYLLPYLEQYHQKYPEVNIKVTNKTTYESLRLLRSGHVDLCFINLPILEEVDLQIMPCISIHDCLMGGEKYQDLARTGMDIKDIGKYPLLLLEELSNSRRYIDQYAKDQGVVLQPILELGSNDLLVEFARINLGMTFVIKEFSQKQLQGGNLFEIPLYPPVPSRSIGLVRLKDGVVSHASKGFTDLMNLEIDKEV